MQIPAYLYFILLGFLASLFVFTQRSAPLYQRLFPFFLFTSILVECTAVYLHDRNVSNLPLYNSFMVLEFGFYLFVLKEIIRSERVKATMQWVVFSFLLIAIVNLLFFEGAKDFNSVNYSLGCLLIVLYCVSFFYELFTLPESVDLIREPSFWIISGLLFHYSTSFPLMGMLNFLSGLPPFLMEGLYLWLTWTNILLYSLFTIAFLCRIRIRNSISS